MAPGGINSEGMLLLKQLQKWQKRLEGTPYSIQLADVEILAEDVPGWQVTSMGSLTVALDVTLTDDLLQEGISRELVNRIQNLRKCLMGYGS